MDEIEKIDNLLLQPHYLDMLISSILKLTLLIDKKAIPSMYLTFYSWLLKSSNQAIHLIIIEIFSYLCLKISPDYLIYHVDHVIPFLIENSTSELAHVTLQILRNEIIYCLPIKSQINSNDILNFKIDSTDKLTLITSINHLRILTCKRSWSSLEDAFCSKMGNALIKLWYYLITLGIFKLNIWTQ
jgi:hypothetical protein